MKSFKKENKSKLMLSVAGGLILCVFVLPLYWVLVASPKTRVETFQIPAPLRPRSLTLTAHVKQVAFSSDALQGFRNSVIISAGTMLIVAALSIPVVYGLARFRFRAGKTIVLLFLITQMLPSALVLTSLYIMFSGISLLNSYWTPILADAAIGIPFSIVILRTYFISIPKELDEATKIDGCGYSSAFFRIMLPIAKPGIVVAAVSSFIYAWGDLIYGITFIIDPTMRLITSSIYNYVQQYQTLWDSTMALGTIATSPVIVIFIFMQRYIISGLTNGAVKAWERSFLCLSKGFRRCLPDTTWFTILFGILISVWRQRGSSPISGRS